MTKRFQSIAAVLLLYFAFCSIANAQQIYVRSGNDLADAARDVVRDNGEQQVDIIINQVAFASYVAGTFDSMSMSFCAPESVTIGQLSVIAANHLLANPQDWHRPAYLIVFEALSESFPCSDR